MGHTKRQPASRTPRLTEVKTASSLRYDLRQASVVADVIRSPFRIANLGDRSSFDAGW